MIRTGNGFDVHKFAEGRKLILGGVNIPYKYGLLGHSDADVLLHAVMDALLGALALGDIGKWFPDDDPEYKNADTLMLLKKIMEDPALNGWHLVNVDCTVIAQRPKIAEYIDAMRKNLAQALAVSIDCVSVKATTTEGLGFCGRGEGIAAMATLLISDGKKN